MLKLKLQYFSHLMQRTDSLEKTLMLGKTEGRRRRGWQDEMVGWHHRLDGCEFEWTPGVGDGQGGLVCCNSWGRKESDTTEQLNWTELNWRLMYKVTQTGRLKTTKIHSLTVLEARSPRSKCHQGHALSLMALRADPSLPLLVSDVWWKSWAFFGL